MILVMYMEASLETWGLSVPPAIEKPRPALPRSREMSSYSHGSWLAAAETERGKGVIGGLGADEGAIDGKTLGSASLVRAATAPAAPVVGLCETSLANPPFIIMSWVSLAMEVRWRSISSFCFSPSSRLS